MLTALEHLTLLMAWRDGEGSFKASLGPSVHFSFCRGGGGSCLCLKFPEFKTTCQFLSALCRRRLDERSWGVGVEGRAGLFYAQPDILLP